jgi:putative membrane protein
MNTQNRNLFIGLGILIVILLLGPILAGGMMGPGAFGPGIMGWGYTTANGSGWLWGLGMGLGGLMMLAFWGVLIVGVVLLVRSLTTHSAGDNATRTSDDALTILSRRYASGDIDEQTYQRMRSELAGTQPSPREPVANGSAREVH